jgi:hypothetical protein
MNGINDLYSVMPARHFLHGEKLLHPHYMNLAINWLTIRQNLPGTLKGQHLKAFMPGVVWLQITPTRVMRATFVNANVGARSLHMRVPGVAVRGPATLCPGLYYSLGLQLQLAGKLLLIYPGYKASSVQ